MQNCSGERDLIRPSREREREIRLHLSYAKQQTCCLWQRGSQFTSFSHACTLGASSSLLSSLSPPLPPSLLFSLRIASRIRTLSCAVCLCGCGPEQSAERRERCPHAPPRSPLPPSLLPLLALRVLVCLQPAAAEGVPACSASPLCARRRERAHLHNDAAGGEQTSGWRGWKW